MLQKHKIGSLNKYFVDVWHYTEWFKSTFTNFGGGVLTPKQGRKSIANADQLHGLHVLPTSIFWIFFRRTIYKTQERDFKLFWYLNLDGVMVVHLSREPEIQSLIPGSDQHFSFEISVMPLMGIINVKWTFRHHCCNRRQ